MANVLDVLETIKSSSTPSKKAAATPKTATEISDTKTPEQETEAEAESSEPVKIKSLETEEEKITKPTSVEEIGVVVPEASSKVRDYIVRHASGKKLSEKEEQEAQHYAQKLKYPKGANREEAPFLPTNDPVSRVDDALNEIVPDNPNKSYDMYRVIAGIVDDGRFFEVHKDFARNIIVGFAHMNGRSVGVVANQPQVLAGVLDINASRKAARFVRFCDAFNIPLVTLVDVPGFLCGTQQEYGAIITNGAKLLYAYGEATVPKVTVTLRKSYGGAHIVMSCKQLRGDINYAWPSAEIAVMGAKGAVEVLKDVEEQEYNDLFCNPYQAAQKGYIEDIIEPRNTRFRVIRALETLAGKHQEVPAKKHDNLPL